VVLGDPGVTTNVVAAVVPTKVPPHEPEYIFQAVASFNVPEMVRVTVLPAQTVAGEKVTVGRVGLLHGATQVTDRDG